MHLDAFKAEGVNTDGIAVAKQGRSGLVMGFVDKKGQRALYINAGANDFVEPREIKWEYVSQTKLLHLTSFVGEKSLRTQKKLVGSLPQGVEISFDPGSVYAQKGFAAIEPLIRNASVMMPNALELELLTGESDYQKGARCLIDAGVKIVAVKLGAKGCYVTDGTEQCRVEAYKVNAVDTTGAGDAFCAGFLYGIIKQQTLTECGRLGNLVASRNSNQNRSTNRTTISKRPGANITIEINSATKASNSKNLKLNCTKIIRQGTDMAEKITLTTDYDIFISYYQSTGNDFAESLWKGLQEFERKPFLDREDIPKTTETESDEWRKYIDNAIKTSPTFVLVMTVGFNNRKEVARELKLAFENRKRIIFMKQVDLATSDLTIDIEGNPTDLSKFEFTSFENNSELIRKVVSVLLGKVKQTNKESTFSRQAHLMMSMEDRGFIKQDPFVEMVVGPTNEDIEWLPPSGENKFLVSCFPYYIGEVEARRTFYEAKNEKPPHAVFLKVTTNGFFHTLVQLVRGHRNGFQDEERFSFDLVFSQMVQPLLYAIRLMKYREVKGEQTVLFRLWHIARENIDFGTFASFRKYSFTNTPVIDGLTYTFNPENDWKEITPMLLKIYKDLCHEAGCVEIEDRIVCVRVKLILHDLDELSTTHSYENVRLPFIEISSFGLEDATW
jgi:sugar/nucleoside kinase (ribokinase family)